MTTGVVVLVTVAMAGLAVVRLGGTRTGDSVADRSTAGAVVQLRNTEGLDVDTGRVLPQDDPGVDLTPGASGLRLLTRSEARIAQVAGSVDCRRLPAPQGRGGVVEPSPEAALCVRTDEGLVAHVTVDSTWNAGRMTMRVTLQEPAP